MLSILNQQYSVVNEVGNIENIKSELEKDLINNEEHINDYDKRKNIANGYNNYISFEYSNYPNQNILNKYYINLQDTSLYNYFTTDDSSFYGKVILDIILKITIVLLIIAIVYYGLQIIDGKLLINDEGIFSNKLSAIKESLKGIYGVEQLLTLEQEFRPEFLYGDHIPSFMKEVIDQIADYGCYIDKFRQPYLRKGSSVIFLVGFFMLVSLILTSKK